MKLTEIERHLNESGPLWFEFPSSRPDRILRISVNKAIPSLGHYHAYPQPERSRLEELEQDAIRNRTKLYHLAFVETTPEYFYEGDANYEDYQIVLSQKIFREFYEVCRHLAAEGVDLEALVVDEK